MNWKYETRRYLYCREEGSFAALSVEARMLAGYILKYTDDKGRIYARAGEELVEALMFRMRASRGARRWMREAYDELVADGYITVVSSTCVRVKNFLVAHAKPEAAPDLNVEAPTNGVRTGDEPIATDAPPRSEPATSEPRAGNEECVKTADSLESDPSLPSVPSGPSNPLVPPDAPPPAPARDPMAPAPLPGRPVEPDSPHALLHCLGVAVRAAHPEVGLWSPGRFAEQDAVRFYERIPQAERKAQAAPIAQRIAAYVAQPSEDGWSVKGFLDRFNALGPAFRPPARASPRSTAVGHARPDLAGTETTGDMTSKL